MPGVGAEPELQQCVNMSEAVAHEVKFARLFDDAYPDDWVKRLQLTMKGSETGAVRGRGCAGRVGTGTCQ